VKSPAPSSNVQRNCQVQATKVRGIESESGGSNFSGFVPAKLRRTNVPQGLLKIAQRFNAGTQAPRETVPKGRLKDKTDGLGSTVPTGLEIPRIKTPALKRRAILSRPFGTTIHRIAERHKS